MKQKQNLAFNTIMTLALCLPIGQSIALASAMRNITQVEQAHPIAALNEIPGWQTCTQGSIAQPDVVGRKYVNQEGLVLTISVRQSSIYRFMHDLWDCLKIKSTPKLIGKLEHQTPLGTLRVSCLEYTYQGKPRLALLWFQNGPLTAADRWEWRWLIARRMGKLPQPILREVLISTTKTTNEAKDMRRLWTEAERMYENRF